MKVILTEDTPNLGTAGSVITVKDGFARNYLIPKGMAIGATVQNISQLEHYKRVVEEKMNKVKRDAEKLAHRIEMISCTISKPAGEEDKLFGSVTSADIHAAVKSEGIDIDKKQILVDEPIKKLGIFSVPIKLHKDVTATLKVWVVKE